MAGFRVSGLSVLGFRVMWLGLVSRPKHPTLNPKQHGLGVGMPLGLRDSGLGLNLATHGPKQSLKYPRYPNWERIGFWVMLQASVLGSC